MAQAPTYDRSTEFAQEERDNVGGRTQLRASRVDAELDRVATSINALQANQELNQRDDGEIRDQRVKLHTLASDVLALILVANGVTPRGAWAAGVQYQIKDLVSQSGNSYLAVTAHISGGSFAVDLAAGRWILISLGASPGASSIPFASTGTIAASNVQAAVEEVDTDLRALTAAAQSDAETAITGLAGLIADLASTSDALKGAALVGIDLQRAYAANTLGDFARQLNPVRKYGALNSDGVTDDAATFQAAAASGARFIDARGLNCRIDSAISIPDGQVWLLHGATLRMASSTQTLFNCDAVDDWALMGKFTIIGDGSTVGTAKGIRISDCKRWLIDAPTIRTVRGWGMYLEPGSSTSSRADHGTVRSPRIDACYIGWEDIAGTGAEYCTVENAHVTGCSAAGIKTAAGNINWKGGHCVDNVLDGMHVNNGSNHAHGAVVGMNINHNNQFNLVTNQVTNGQDFIGCHFYGNGASTGALFFDRSKGIHLHGGHLDCQLYNYKDGSSGLNVIENMYCPGGYGINRQPGSNNGHDQLIVKSCFGPGVYASSGGLDTAGVTINDPSDCYVLAQRDAGSTQALVSGVAADLIWPSEPFPDRRSAYATGTGIFTAPASQAGLYRIEFDALFGATAANAAASFVELVVAGVTKKLWFTDIFGADKLQSQGSHDIYLNGGDTVKLRATITGTSPSFGDATWPSNFSVKRLA